MKRTRNVTGKKLCVEWSIDALHCLYRDGGKWYHILNDFPGALCDDHGYIRFESESEFLNCQYLKIGVDVNVPGTISKIPGYVRMM